MKLFLGILAGLGITGLVVSFIAMIIDTMIHVPLPGGFHWIVGPSLIAMMVVMWTGFMYMLREIIRE